MNMDEFLSTLYRGAEGYLSVWTKKDKVTTWFDIKEVQGQELKYLGMDDDVYFGVCLRKERGDYKSRGSLEDVSVMPGFWVDLDTFDPASKKNYPEATHELLDILGSFPLSPSIVVDSGFGLHVYWLFTDPIDVNDDNRALMASYSEAFQSRFRDFMSPFTCDATHDLPRILRLPETFNRKEQFQGIGSARQVRVLYPASQIPIDQVEIPRYDLEDFNLDPVMRAKVSDQVANFIVDSKAALPGKAMTLFKQNKKALKTWEGSRTDLNDISPSGYDMSLAVQALQSGLDFTDQELVDFLVCRRRACNEPEKLRVDYYSRTINTARTLVGTGQEQINTVSKPEVNDVDKDNILTYLSSKLKITVNGIIKYDSIEPTYRLVTDMGNITIGSISDLRKYDKVADAVGNIAHVLPPPYTKAQWHPIAAAMLKVAETVVSEESTERGIIIGYLERYLQANTPITVTDVDWSEAMTASAAFIYEGNAAGITQSKYLIPNHVYFTVSGDTGFETYITSRVKMTRQEITTALAQQGIDSCKFQIRVNNRTVSRYYWHVDACILSYD